MSEAYAEQDRMEELERVKAAEQKALHFTIDDWEDLIARMVVEKELTAPLWLELLIWIRLIGL